MTGKERFFNVLSNRPADRVPVFPLLMSFAAKRYGISYAVFASDGQALAEAQLNIADKFPIDAITACSDAFRISADLGGDIVFPEDKPPHLSAPLVRDESDFNRLKKPDAANPKGRMADRVRSAGEMARHAGDRCAALGWVDLPFAESCSLCGVSEFMMMLYDQPELAHKILGFLTEIVIEFAVAQIEAGAPMIGAGDAAASLISPELYREFALPYEKQVADAVHKAGGFIKLHICGNTSAHLPYMPESGCDLFNVDHMVELAEAAEVYGNAGKAFKGNINPVADMLHATPEQCAAKARACIEAAKGRAYMLSPGCEVPAEVSDETFMAFCRAVN